MILTMKMESIDPVSNFSRAQRADVDRDESEKELMI